MFIPGGSSNPPLSQPNHASISRAHDKISCIQGPPNARTFLKARTYSDTHAAARRSLGRISVPVWLIILSDQLRIVALVSRYLTN